MKASALILLTTTCSLALASCGVSIRSGSHFTQNADVSRPLTYAWSQVAEQTGGDHRLRNNKFFEDRLHEAVEWELSMRGFRPATESPDLLIHHHLSLADHVMVDESIDEAGYTRTEVFSYEEGTIVLHIVDARTGSDVWVAWAQANIEPAFHGPENMRKWVYDVVQAMFRRWPVATGMPG